MSNVSCLELVDVQKLDDVRFWLTNVTLIAFNIVVVVGNTLIIGAVVKLRKLRTVNTFLITSLAAADLAVGIFVLPFSIANETLRVWIFGDAWCQIWLAVDVWLCTASIYNLVVISFDRYIAITRPLTYPLLLTSNRGKLLIIAAWSISFLICFPPMVINWPETLEAEVQLLTTTPDRATANKVACQCTPMNNSQGYIIYSASGSFLLPTVVIITLYVKIYWIIRRVSRNMAGGFIKVKTVSCTQPKVPSTSHNDSGDADSIDKRYSVASNMDKTFPPHEGLRVHRGGGGSSASISRQISSPLVRRSCSRTAGDPVRLDCRMRQIRPPPMLRLNTAPNLYNREALKQTAPTPLLTVPSYKHRHIGYYHTSPVKRKVYFGQPRCRFMRSINSNVALISEQQAELKQKGYQKRLYWEIQALKSVAIVTGCFIICWAGFAVCYLMRAFDFCHFNDCIPQPLFSVVFWLGYLNSACNPFIYAMFNREFRRAFRSMLCCCCGRDTSPYKRHPDAVL